MFFIETKKGKFVQVSQIQEVDVGYLSKLGKQEKERVEIYFEEHPEDLKYFKERFKEECFTQLTITFVNKTWVTLAYEEAWNFFSKLTIKN